MMIGPQAIPELSSYLATGYGLFARICVANGIKEIGIEYPDSREQCVETLTKQLTQFSHNDESLNGFLISFLVNLEAVVSIDVIRKAFQNESVDHGIIGDFEDIEIAMGLRLTRSTQKLELDFDKYRQTTNHSFDLPESKVGRNDPCPCGSGKKYKKCCLRKNAESLT